MLEYYIPLEMTELDCSALSTGKDMATIVLLPLVRIYRLIQFCWWDRLVANTMPDKMTRVIAVRIA